LTIKSFPADPSRCHSFSFLPILQATHHLVGHLVSSKTKTTYHAKLIDIEYSLDITRINLIKHALHICKTNKKIYITPSHLQSIYRLAPWFKWILYSLKTRKPVNQGVCVLIVDSYLPYQHIFHGLLTTKAVIWYFFFSLYFLKKRSDLGYPFCSWIGQASSEKIKSWWALIESSGILSFYSH
jgi:hypothetical protein